MIRVIPSAYLLAAALVLLLPLDWLIAALLAATIHELGHLSAILALGGRPEFISIGGAGTKIHTGPLGNRSEFLCAAAGPAASLLLIALCRFLPKLAVCGLIQGMFNLLPLHPMDGGRMLYCGLRRLCPRRADRLFPVIQCLTLCVLLVLSLMISIRGKAGFFSALGCMSVLSRLLLSKIPCKSA